MESKLIVKAGKSENSKTDEERKDQDEEKMCKSIIKKASQDAIVRNTRYWQRLEKKINTSYALMTSMAKICRGMECAMLVV